MFYEDKKINTRIVEDLVISYPYFWLVYIINNVLHY